MIQVSFLEDSCIFFQTHCSDANREASLHEFDNLAENPCDALPAPYNGAMVCDTWQYGLQCQMQCSRQYDIPFGTVGSNGAPFTGLFTCSEVKGTYGPSNTVPGCTRMLLR